MAAFRDRLDVQPSCSYRHPTTPLATLRYLAMKCAQFQTLKAGIQNHATHATHAELSNDIGGTSSESSGAGSLSIGVSDPPTHGKVQAHHGQAG